jgi:hypothetical protein
VMEVIELRDLCVGRGPIGFLPSESVDASEEGRDRAGDDEVDASW